MNSKKTLPVVLLVGAIAVYLYAHPRAPEKPATVTIEPGTTVEVRLDHGVSSKTSFAGERFSGKLAKAIVMDGKMIAPEGTEFSGKVMEADPAGHLAGGAKLKIALNSFSLEGTEYPIHCSEIVRVSQGQGKRTAKFAGGGAVIGAAVGALAHGKKGALIGAAVGAGAGAAGSAATNTAHDVVMPADSVVTFKVTQSLEIAPKAAAQSPHDLVATIRGMFS